MQLEQRIVAALFSIDDMHAFVFANSLARTIPHRCSKNHPPGQRQRMSKPPDMCIVPAHAQKPLPNERRRIGLTRRSGPKSSTTTTRLVEPTNACSRKKTHNSSRPVTPHCRHGRRFWTLHSAFDVVCRRPFDERQQRWLNDVWNNSIKLPYNRSIYIRDWFANNPLCGRAHRARLIRRALLFSAVAQVHTTHVAKNGDRVIAYTECRRMDDVNE